MITEQPELESPADLPATAVGHDLLPCPFCGAMPSINRMYPWISCENVQCPACVSVLGNHPDEDLSVLEVRWHTHHTIHSKTPVYVPLPQEHRLRYGVDIWLVEGSQKWTMTTQHMAGIPVKGVASRQAMCKFEDYPYTQMPEIA